MKTNIYGRELPIDAQEAIHSSECVDCHHAHYDTLRHRYARCGICGPGCLNVGANDFEFDARTLPLIQATAHDDIIP